MCLAIKNSIIFIDFVGVARLESFLFFQVNRTLLVLNLASNVIDTDGAFAFAAAIRKNRSLRELNLEHNLIDELVIDELEKQDQLDIEFMNDPDYYVRHFPNSCFDRLVSLMRNHRFLARSLLH